MTSLKPTFWDECEFQEELMEIQNKRRELEYLSKFVEYVRNCGGRISITAFDDDWSPVGVGIRGRLVSLRMLQYDGVGNLVIPPNPMDDPKAAVKVEKI